MKPKLEYFESGHLLPALRRISKRFEELAKFLCDEDLDKEECAVALRKLLEAKDAAVRAAIFNK